MKRYESYKDSGVKWLGEIPGHWEVYKLKYLFRLNKIKNVGNKCNTILSLSYGKIIIKKDLNEGLTPESYESYQLLNKGDIVIRSTDLQNDHTSLRTGLVKSDGAITSAYIGLKNLNVNLYDSRYYHYFLHDWDITKAIYNEGKGLRQSLNWDDIKNMLLPVLDINEQTAIANYLDSVTSKIDEAISQQQKMIDLLNERKQIIIQNAVTKGLDPNAKMKDSGVEWIGEIPENWRLNRFKNLFKTRSGITFTKKQIVEYGESVISYGQIHSKDNYGSRVNPELIRFIPKKLTKNKGKAKVVEGDFLFADTSEDFEGCGNNVYIDCKTPIYAGYHTILAKKNNNEVGQYLAYLFASRNWRGQVRSLVNGVKVYSITQTILKSVYVVLPPIEEQLSIAEYLNVKVGNIDKKIKSIENYISLLQERKQIIINDVVTGKVKVI